MAAAAPAPINRFRKPDPPIVDLSERLDWDFAITPPPPRRSGSIMAKLNPVPATPPVVDID